jgi:hypothetical protein
VVGLLKPDELLTYEQDIGEAMKAHFDWENVNIKSDGGCTGRGVHVGVQHLHSIPAGKHALSRSAHTALLLLPLLLPLLL